MKESAGQEEQMTMGKKEKENAGEPCLLELSREGCRVLGQTHSSW